MNMADPPPPTTNISAAFPAPPPFYKSFTAQNISHLEDVEPAAALSLENPSQTPSPSINLDALPSELRHLIPPPPPADGKYTIFGELHEARGYCPTTFLSIDK